MIMSVKKLPFIEVGGNWYNVSIILNLINQIEVYKVIDSQELRYFDINITRLLVALKHDGVLSVPENGKYIAGNMFDKFKNRILTYMENNPEIIQNIFS